MQQQTYPEAQDISLLETILTGFTILSEGPLSDS